MTNRLVLFDIDGTLILDDGAAREAFAAALWDVYRFKRGLRDYDFSGKTDPEITYTVLGDGGFSAEEIGAKLPEMWERYLAELSARVSAHRVRVLRGVLELLELLHQNDRVTLALLTGNIERGARVKLSAHDLNRYFHFGAFGSDSMNREELPPIAVERASRIHRKEFGARDVVVIGDSIYDVRCGVPHRATTIAVATGKTPAEKLRAENPDFLFDSLEPGDELLRAILG